MWQCLYKFNGIPTEVRFIRIAPQQTKSSLFQFRHILDIHLAKTQTSNIIMMMVTMTTFHLQKFSFSFQLFFSHTNTRTLINSRGRGKLIKENIIIFCSVQFPPKEQKSPSVIFLNTYFIFLLFSLWSSFVVCVSIVTVVVKNMCI